jgi:hypothetical protein
MRLRLSTRPTTLALGALAAACGLAGQASAQDCKISMHAGTDVAYAGQSIAVDAFASFPASAHALASAGFDVQSTHPAWSSASGGAIVGNAVLGIAAGQAHNPPLGIVADPSNPYRLWHATHVPSFAAPAVVQYAAQPLGLTVYPSALTSSSVPCDTLGGTDLVLVNPLKAAGVQAAPGRGTEARIRPAADDVVVDGKIITAEAPTPLLIGLLLPAVQKSEPPCFTLDMAYAPSTLAIGVRTQRPAPGANGSPSLNLTRIEFQASPLGLQVADASESLQPGLFRAFHGGVEVARGGLDRAGAPMPALSLAGTPRHVSTQAVHKRSGGGGGLTMGVSIVYALGFDAPVQAFVHAGQGEPVAVSVDRIELETSAGTMPRGDAQRAGRARLGIHTFEANGVDAMRVVVKGADRPQVCRR